MGSLGKTNTFKHLVYHTQTPLGAVSDAKTLKQLLQQAFDERKQYKCVEKLKLARTLALSVLRFHSTGWLPRSWSSDDIIFFRATGNDIVATPHLSRRLLNEEMNSQISTEKDSPSIFLPNHELFSLGVVLIELGYDSPFDKISSVSQSLSAKDLQSQNFLAARDLGAKVDAKFNWVYGDLVENCLHCDFGVGRSLETTKLQNAVLVDVVNQLDFCLEKYYTFQHRVPPSH